MDNLSHLFRGPLRALRWQLAALYALASLGLVIFLSGGAYAILRYYFQSTTDLALEYKMAQIFHENNLPLPVDLANAEQAWLAGLPGWTGDQSGYAQSNVASPSSNTGKNGDEDRKDREQSKGDHDDGDDDDHHDSDEEHDDDFDDLDHLYSQTFDGQVAPIFTLLIDANTMAAPPESASPLSSDRGREAVQAALTFGSDRRTVRIASGARVRLLTYRSPTSTGPAVFQVGRFLSDQDRVLSLFLVGMVIFGTGTVGLLGAAGWWLSGRTLNPAQQAWDRQHTFVSNASHELRTPLTIIRATADYGLRLQPQGEVEQVLADIIGECDYMTHMVDDLLLLARLDTGRLQVASGKIDLEPFLFEIHRQISGFAQEKGINIQLKQVRGTVIGDATHLRQVLLILLDNALRYTPPGGVVDLGTTNRGAHAEIFVTDNGVGIPEQHLPHVFERFYHIDRPGIDAQHSQGLGLSIAKALVETQNGRIEISSRVGLGTQVVVRLPAGDK